MATIQEMHLQIDLELNKLNSNLYDIILSQEKDYFLNKAQERFIKQRYSSKSNSKRDGFEMSQKRIDDLKNLLVPNYYDKTYKLASDDFDLTTKSKFYFPADYMFLTSTRSKITYNPCGTITKQEAVKTYYIATTNLNPAIESYQYLKVWVDGTCVINFADPATLALYPGLANLTKEDKGVVLEFILNNIAHIGLKFYSTFKNYSANIVAVGEAMLWGNIGFSYTSGAIVPVNPTEAVAVNYTYFTATGTQDVVPNRFAQQDDVYVMQQDPFNKTNVLDGPLTIIHTNSIDVFFEPDIFIVNEIAISYLRKPKLMSLTINQSCELDEETHAEILRDAVNLLLEDFEADKRLSTSLMVEATNE